MIFIQTAKPHDKPKAFTEILPRFFYCQLVHCFGYIFDQIKISRLLDVEIGVHHRINSMADSFCHHRYASSHKMVSFTYMSLRAYPSQ